MIGADRRQSVPSELERHWTDIEATRRPILKASPVQESRRSQLGGTPWWPADEPYPRSKNGDPLFLLIQIDFAEAPALESFPSSGVLQVFIDGWGGPYGANHKDPFSTDGFACCFHDDASRRVLSDFSFLSPIRKARFLKFFERDESASLPLLEPLAPIFLDLSASSMPIDVGDYRFSTMLPRLNADEAALDAYCDWLEKNAPPIRLGGYPSFRQADPREHGAARGDFTLLMIDTTDGIMWGDGGAAQFFIDEEAWARRDFSKVAYNWDCC